MMNIKGMLRITSVAIACMAAVGIAGASEERFFANLDGGQVIPPVASTATARADMQLSADRTELAFTLAYSGIDPTAITSAQIHVGAPVENGPVIFDLLAVQPLPGPYATPIAGALTAVNLTPQPAAGVATFDDALAKMESGLAYVIIGTTGFPDGEIRGQLGLVVDLKVRRAINPRNKGVISVWILSSPGFDATTVDPATVAFGPLGAWSAAKLGDVNEDGLADLHFKFRTRETGIQCGDRSVTLEGATAMGVLIEGSSPIKTPGCNGHLGGSGAGSHGHSGGQGY